MNLKTDFLVKDLSESPLTRLIGEKIKQKANYIVNFLSRFKL